MQSDSQIKLFPDYFTSTIVQELKDNGGCENNFSVYRVDKYGNNDKTAFYNYYEEVIHGLKTVRNKEKALEKYLSNIDSLSVSCDMDCERVKYYFNITLKDQFPERKLLYGITSSSEGLSRITKEWKDNYKGSSGHIDWWLYKDAEPNKFFKEVMIDE